MRQNVSLQSDQTHNRYAQLIYYRLLRTEHNALLINS